MPKVSEEHREQRRKQILDAAERSFARKGFHDTSMSDIIGEAGLSVGAIYGHYASKSELIAAVAEQVFAPAQPRFQPVRDDNGVPLHPLDFADRVSDNLLSTVGGSGLPLQVWGEATVDDNLRHAFLTVFGGLLGGIRAQIVLWLTEVKELADDEADALADGLASLVGGLLQGALVQTEFVSGFDRGAYLRIAHPVFDSIEPASS
ncbi:TetR/AcrR family transcriptional regulator [Humibacter albus]|jgi:AcrR family transcriptional regulator|uniref:TetR/AcrR family transcriptional regulator n=1 Tax=Humibacter albus TaxID=427754 RepID=UPI0003B5E66A|nr:TetR/AcrR family transcriptional regulator [Humibacter albus]